MKKLLVASTALVAVAAVSSANAADPIKISVGGYMNQYVGFVDQDEDGGQDYEEFSQSGKTELYFRGNTTLDNGLTIGVNIDRYSDRDDTGGDDIFLQISSDSMGKVRIGQTKGAAYALSHSAPEAGATAVNDDDISDFVNDPGNVTSDQTQTASEGNDGQKIIYWTPNFGGFTAGLSYGKNNNNASEDAVYDEGGTNTLNDKAFDAGIAYNGDLGGVSLGADVTYQRDFNGGTTGTAVEDRKSVRAGLVVGVAGFSIGGSYRDTSNEGNVKNVDASGWNAGVTYETGPYAVGFTYMQTEQEDGAGANAQDDTVDIWHVGGEYDLGAGVTLVGSVFGVEYDDASSNAANSTTDNEGFGVVAGLKVSF